MALNEPLGRKLRMALVGGGQGSFIGRVHCTAAVLDNRAELVAGALSADPERAKASAPDYGIAPERAYASYQEMIETESSLPENERIDFVSIATPNHTHYEIAAAAISAGFNVICDKPMTFDLEQAENLAQQVKDSDVIFALTHNYTGYPLVRQARQMIQEGEIGEVQAIRVTYLQGWLRNRIEQDGQKQAAWRTDPSRSGAAGCYGDIGTHAYNLARFMTSLLPDKVSSHLNAFESGRVLDDYGTTVIRFENGGVATLVASQISHGRENELFIDIDGTQGAFQWNQEDPNRLMLRRNGETLRVFTRDPNAPFMNSSGAASCRLPSGHPEGFFEAFANIYRAAFDDMALRATGQTVDRQNTVYPNVNDGAEGMYFIQQCVASSQDDGAWLPLKHDLARP